MEDRNLTEAQARALWERAARLQAESAARQLGSGSGSETGDLGDGSDAVRSDGAYSVDVVVRSAVEAGIPAEFIEQALTEMGPGSEGQGRVDRWAEAWVGDDTPTLSAQRVIHAPVAEVYAAMQRVFPNVPYGLNLAGTDGRPPLEGGVLTFEVPYSLAGLSGTVGTQAVTDLRHWADVKELKVRLRPVDGEDSRTEVQMWASLGNTRRVNYWTGNVVGGVFGLVAGVLTAAITAATINPVVAAEVATALGAGGAVGGGTFLSTRLWWRPFYRLALRRGRRGMDRLIDALVVDLQTGGGFTRRVPPGGPGEDGTTALLMNLGL